LINRAIIFESAMCERKPMARIIILLIPLIFIACSSEIPEIKIATYNIYFLDDGISQERKSNLQQVINKLDADIIGFQEINSPAALKNILPSEYTIAMIDDPGQVQELALAVRPPFKIKSYKYVFPDTIHDNAFPRTRDLLEVEVAGYRKEFVIWVHHAKSRSGGRLKTDSRREAAARLMVGYMKSNLAAENVILIGDFNDNPDDRSLNILEYEDKDAVGGVDCKEDDFLFNTSEKLLSKDYCSYGYSRLFKETVNDTFQLTVAGARIENNKWRGIEHNYFNDVKIKTILLDQILVSINLKKYVYESGVFNYSTAIKGERSRVRFVEGELQFTKRGSLASDHVPVWTILKFN